MSTDTLTHYTGTVYSDSFDTKQASDGGGLST